MIPYDIDPSLHTAEPESQVLDDGFSPTRHGAPAATAQEPPADVVPTDSDLSGQS
jgi:hypothetical protein